MNDNKNMDSFPEINKFCLWIKKSLMISKGNQNSYIEEQTKQWHKEKGQTTTIYKTYI